MHLLLYYTYDIIQLPRWYHLFLTVTGKVQSSTKVEADASKEGSWALLVLSHTTPGASSWLRGWHRQHGNLCVFRVLQRSGAAGSFHRLYTKQESHCRINITSVSAAHPFIDLYLNKCQQHKILHVRTCACTYFLWMLTLKITAACKRRYDPV